MAKDKRLLTKAQLRLCQYHGGVMVFDHIDALAEQLKQAQAENAALKKRIKTLEVLAD